MWATEIELQGHLWYETEIIQCRFDASRMDAYV